MKRSRAPAPLKTAGHRHRQSGQAARVPGAARGFAVRSRWRRSALGVPAAEETGATFARERLAEGAPRRARRAAPRRSPTTPGSRSTRSAARRACTRRAMPARAPAMPPTMPSSCAALRGVPPSGGARAIAARWCIVDGPTIRRRCAPRAAGRACILDAPRGRGGFGYDPYFWIPELELTAAELEPRAQESAEPPRPGAARIALRARSVGRRRAVMSRCRRSRSYVHMPWCVRKCPYCDFNSHQLKSAAPPRRATSMR